MRLNYLLAGAAMALAAASAASAGTPALSFDQNTGSGALANPPFTLGWEFNVVSSIKVDGLGVFDANQDGLQDSYDIGIWDNSSNLVASGTLGSGTSGTLIDNFRYVGISSVTLNAGTYFIGAFYGDTADSIVFPGQGGAVSTISAIQYVQSTYGEGGSLADPTNQFGTPGYYGPNFTAVPGGVPEPASWALMLTGFFGMGSMLRANRRRTATAA